VEDDHDAPKTVNTRRARPPASALNRAVGLLSRREHSERELSRKLVQRGLEPEEVGSAIRRLQSLSLQSDERFAENLIRSRAQSGHGPLHIRAELALHGLTSTSIDMQFDSLAIDWNACAALLAQRRCNKQSENSPSENRRIANTLLRRGFSMDHVRHALRTLSDTTDNEESPHDQD
jgi:regulatory protein